MARERIVTPNETAADASEPVSVNHALRPQRFAEYVGQEPLIRKLRIAVEAARTRKEPVEHVLLHGPPGLGKTTLSHVIAREMGAQLHTTSGPVLTKGADLVGILTKLAPGDVLFIDEIHRLPVVVEEYLYSAMEDFKVDITLEQGTHARAVTLPLPPFTLIGATTRLGLMTGPMRDRFGIREHLEFYSPASLVKILTANAVLLSLVAAPEAIEELARRCRGTPRIANRLLRRVRDYALVEGTGEVTSKIAALSLKLEGIDAIGLDEQDRQYLRTLIDVYEGGPAGVEAIAATLSEEVDTLVDVIEPYLLQIGLVMRTRQGRRVTKTAYEHLGLPVPAARTPATDTTLFEEAE